MCVLIGLHKTEIQDGIIIIIIVFRLKIILLSQNVSELTSHLEVHRFKSS